MRLLLLLLLPLLPAVAEEWSAPPLITGEVTASVRLGIDPVTGTGRLTGTFETSPWVAVPFHLYAITLPPDGLEGAGRPTRLALLPEQVVRAVGPLEADRKVESLSQPGFSAGFPVYPPGKLTVQQAVRVEGALPDLVRVEIGFMACNAQTCAMPVLQVLELRRPGATPAPTSAVPPHAPATAPRPSPEPMTAPRLISGLPALLRLVLAAVAALAGSVAFGLIRPWCCPSGQSPGPLRFLAGVVAWTIALHSALQLLPQHDHHQAIPWQRVASAADLEARLAQAAKAGQAVLLDFTGPSCANCQAMEKTVFSLPAIRAGWLSGLPIQVDTDPPHQDLAAWQQARFKTQSRPFFVRVEADGRQTVWNGFVGAGETRRLQALAAFLQGQGGGQEPDLGQGWGPYLLLAVLGGLFTLVMPCTYPMIPFTIAFFARQAAEGRHLLPLAASYAAGIIASFTGFGLLVGTLGGGGVAAVAGHPLTNLLIAGLFVGFGLSLLDLVFLRLPAGLTRLGSDSRAGHLGALIMGATFAITAFTCTAPFAGLVLAQAASAADAGTWLRASLGMAVYSATFALPFLLLGLLPGLAARLPRAGTWMVQAKAVGALVELAAALKFLVICDVAWRLDLLGRNLVLVAWAVAALVAAGLLAGWVRLADHEDETPPGLLRLLASGLLIGLAIWFAAGAAGRPLGGIIEGFFPTITR